MMNLTEGMWQFLSEQIDGEKLPKSLNEAIYGLCDGSLMVVPQKELSDEEIWAIASVIEPIDLACGIRLSNEFNVLDFARAIIKASRGEE